MKKILIAMMLAVICWGLCAPQVSFGQEKKELNMVTKNYDVLDLLIAHPDNISGSILAINESYFTPPPSPFCSDQDLVELCKSFYAGDWEKAGMSIEFYSPILVIRATPEIHKQVEILFAYLRQLKNQTVTIEAKLVVMENAAWQEIQDKTPAGNLLDDKTAEGILKKGDIYKAAQKTIFNGQHLSIKDVISTAFIRDYDIVMAAPNEGTADPIMSVLEEGIMLNLQPIINSAGNEVLVNVHMETNELIAMNELDIQSPISKGYNCGLFYLPHTKMTQLKTTLRIPDKKTMIAGTANIKGTSKTIIVLITPTISETEDKKSALSEVKLSNNQSLRILDMGELTTQFGNYESVFLLRTMYNTAAGLSFPMPPPVELPTKPILELDNLIMLLITNTPEGNWNTTGMLKSLGNKHVVVINSPEIIKKITDCLSDLVKQNKFNRVNVETKMVEINDEYWQGLKGKNMLALTPDTAKELMAEAVKGEKARSITTAEVVGLNGQKVFINQGELKNYVKDLDAVAGVLAYAPVLDTIGSGTSLEVYPLISGDNSLDVWVNFKYADLLNLDVVKIEKGRFQKPTLNQKSFMGNVNLTSGNWKIISVTTDKDTTGKLKHTVMLIKADILK